MLTISVRVNLNRLVQGGQLWLAFYFSEGSLRRLIVVMTSVTIEPESQKENMTGLN
jgi:hypothetical protein